MKSMSYINVFFCLLKIRMDYLDNAIAISQQLGSQCGYKFILYYSAQRCGIRLDRNKRDCDNLFSKHDGSR